MKKLEKRYRYVLALTAILAAGCTSGEGGSGMAPLTVAVTDAASDELASFCVELEAITLTRASGATVGALPAPVVVDLVTLEEVSQVLNVLNVPLGLYTQASVTLDFDQAEAYLRGSSTPATLLDGDGNPLVGSVTIPITIGNLFSAIAGRHRILELDFDLDQSVMVDTPGNEVRISPLIVMRVDRTDPKDLIAGGGLVAVDLAMNRIDVELQTLNRVPITPVVIGVDASTVYQIDGVPSTGNAGLTALSLLPADTWVQWYGAINVAEARIDAVYVEAGTGTYNGGSDIVEGHVIGRVGGAGANATLTVLGHSNNASHTTFQFNTTFTVDTDFVNTRVPLRGTAVAADTDAVNIGQRIRVFGALSGTNLDATAATDVLRIQPTRVLGFANAPDAGGVLDLDLVRVGLRDESEFSWNEGGPTPPAPATLQLDVGSLGNGLGIQVGTAIEAIGFFSAYADSAEDFTATALINRDLAPSLLVVHDRLGGQTVTPVIDTTPGSESVELTLAGSAGVDEIAVVDRGFVGVLPLTGTQRIEPTPPLGLGIFLIHDRVTGMTTLHLSFADFAATLDAALAQSAVIYDFGAVGPYDDPSDTMTVGLVAVSLN